MKHMVRRLLCLEMIAGLAFGALGAVLPDEYAEVDYIRSTGVEQIDTEVVINRAHEIRFRYSMVIGKFTPIFSNASSGLETTWLRDDNGNVGWFYVNFMCTNTRQVKGVIAKSDEIVEGYVKGATTNNNCYYKLNGQEGSFARTAGTANTTSLKIFSTSADTTKPTAATLYSFSIVSNGETSVTIADFVPCVRLADGVSGLYDVARGAFYGNTTGTGGFSHGPFAASSLVADPIADQMFEPGTLSTPTLTVRNAGGQALVADVDYTVEYFHNAVVGEAYAVVKGKAGTDYAGQVAVFAYQIRPVYHVTSDAEGGGNGLTWASPMTLAEGLAAAQAGEFVLVKAGRYPISAAYTIDRPITIRGSMAGTDNVTLAANARTVLDATVDGVKAAGIFTVKTATAEADFNRFENLDFTGVNVSAQNCGAITKTGKASIAFENCRFYDNVAASYQSTAALRLTGTAATDAVISNCLFVGNVISAGATSGGAVYCATFRELRLEDCLFTSNGVPWQTELSWSTGRDGFVGAVLFANAAPVKARNCRFLANRAVGSTDHAGGETVRIAGKSGGSIFDHCQWVGNDGAYGWFAGGNSGYNFGAFVMELDATASSAELRACTVAYNLANGDVSGAGVLVSKGTLNVVNSIVYGNIRGAKSTVGADLHVKADGYAVVSNTLFTASGAESVSSVEAADLQLDRESVIYGDPCFVTPLETVRTYVIPSTVASAKNAGVIRFAIDGFAEVSGFDVHERSPKGYFTNGGTLVTDASAPVSPVLDRAIAGTPCDLEPTPNGDAANLGVYGGTAEAAKTPVGQPEIDVIDVAFPNGYTRPEIRVALGGEEGAMYSATVTLTCKTGGVTMVSQVLRNVACGVVITNYPNVYLLNGDTLAVDVSVSASGATTRTDAKQFAVTGALPPWFRKGGPANVIHVREGADGDDTGANWTDALSSLEKAVASVTAGKDEIWLAGSFGRTMTLSITAKATLAVRGGFTGAENAPEERPEGTVATLDGGGNDIQLIALSNGADIPVLVERVRFAHGGQGFVKTGAGDIALSGCAFVDNRKGNANGIGVSLTGTAAAHAVVTNCVIAGNNGTGTSIGSGQGLYLATFASAEIVDTLLATNGIAWGAGDFWSTGRDGQSASAAYVTGAPTSFRRCAFVAHRASGYSGNGGAVRLAGASGGSSFDHCRFVGNDETYQWNDTTGPAGGSGGGAINVNLANAADEVAIRGCTIAYNHSANVGSAAGVTVAKGTLVVRDSILFGNVRALKGAVGADLCLKTADAYADIAYSLVRVSDQACVTAANADNFTFGDGIIEDDPNFVSAAADVRALIVFHGTQKTNERFDVNRLGDVLAIDVHALSPKGYFTNVGGPVVDSGVLPSAAIDAGDPASPWENEGTPNGGCVNLGCYGNTPEAAKTSVAQPEIAAVDVVFTNGYTRPYVTVRVGGEPDDSFLASVTVDFIVDGESVASDSRTGVLNGGTAVFYPCVYLRPGKTLTLDVRVGAKGAQERHSDATQVTVTGVVPPWAGKGGGASVLHVREGAVGTGTGVNWADAYPSIDEALAHLTPSHSEIWIAGRLVRTLDLPALKPTVPLAVRGGFTGAEDAPEERTDGAVSALVGGGAAKLFEINNGAGVPVTFERLQLLNGKQGIVKTGAGDLTISDCAFVSNRVSSANGIGVSITGGSGTRVVVSNCVVRYNTGSSTSIGTGQGMYVSSVADLEIADTQFLENGIAWTDADFWNNGRDGQYASALHLTGTRFVVRNCRFSANRGSCYSNRGSTVRVNGGCNGSLFDHCRWVGNEEDYHWFDTNNPEGGNYSGQVSVELSNVTDEVGFKNCTIAYNHTGNKLSGAGITVIKGKAVISNSIIANNVRGETCQVGADLCLLNANAFADVSYTMFTTNDPVSVSTVVEGNLDLQGGIVYGDPLFVTPYGDVKALIVGIGNSPKINKRFSSAKLAEVLAIDVHLLSSEGYVTNGAPNDVWCEAEQGVLSPAIDGGDPNDTDLAALEPPRNGGVVNMGVYGGTSVASKTPYGEPQVDGEIAVTWDELPDSRPTVRFRVGGIGAFTASATVTLTDESGQFDLYKSLSIDGLAYGDQVVCPVNLCFAPGTFRVKVNIKGAGQTNEYVTEPVTVEGELPPWWDAKGPDNVIHVRPGAYGANDGTCWRDAFTSIRAAFASVSSNKTEIWLAGTNVLATGSATLKTDCPTWVRGGFRGWETAEAERPSGARSTVDGANVTDCLTVNNATNMVIERMVFIRGQNHGLSKSGAGDLRVESCLFLTNGASQNSNSGSGKGAYVAGAAGRTRVTFRDCLFKGNRTTGSGSSPVGGGVRAATLGGLRLEDCEFVHNGTHIAQPNVGNSSDASSGGTQGVAVYSDSPVSAERCRFVANFGCLRYELSLGGIVRLAGAACGSAFTNCVWAGNSERIVWENTDVWKEPWSKLTCGGALTVYLDSFDGTVDVQNCTFAHGLADGFTSPAGINVIQGAVNVRNSIFHCNRTSDSQYRPGRDIAVWQTSSCTVGYTMFDGLDTNFVTCAETATTNFADVIVADPCFVTDDATVTGKIRMSGKRFNYNWGDASVYGILENLNVHLVSRVGYVDKATGALVSTYSLYRSRRVGNSPAVDAGDPASCYRREGERKDVGSHGRRVNLGAYGNTPWSTMTPVRGAFVNVR